MIESYELTAEISQRITAINSMEEEREVNDSTVRLNAWRSSLQIVRIETTGGMVEVN